MLPSLTACCLLLISILVVACAATPDGESSIEDGPGASDVARELRVRVGKADLYVRELGVGPLAIVLHGGPDFDCRYLLPEMDRLAERFRLVYYDQRGRGRSASGVRAQDVSLESEIADLDAVRQHFGPSPVTLVGHSWGSVLALEYALRHPEHVAQLVLLNPAPASRADFLAYLQSRNGGAADDLELKRSIAATPAYQQGDPEAVTAYYRAHFRSTFRRPEDLERILPRFAEGLSADGVLLARAVEQRLLAETWLREDYDLAPKLKGLDMPAVVVWSERDFIPRSCAEHISDALPNARWVVLEDCGHFAYFERPDALPDLIEIRAAGS
jgi:proline iminopeptidase